jgi:DNA-binding transcriptional ArsR family regulator
MLLVEPVAVADLRLQANVNSQMAAMVLRDLVADGAAVRQATKRRDRFVLAPELAASWQRRQSQAARPGVTDVLRANDWTTSGELSAATGLARSSVTWWLRRLLKEGKVETEGATRSPGRRYRWIAAEDNGAVRTETPTS